MDELTHFIANDAFARHLGIELLDYDRGHGRARMEITAQHLNSAGTLHGGAIFSLADAALAVAANSHGSRALAIDVSASFCKAAREGALIAEARDVARSTRLASYRIEVVEEEGGGLIAQLQGTVYRTRAGITQD